MCFRFLSLHEGLVYHTDYEYSVLTNNPLCYPGFGRYRWRTGWGLWRRGWRWRRWTRWVVGAGSGEREREREREETSPAPTLPTGHHHYPHFPVDLPCPVNINTSPLGQSAGLLASWPVSQSLSGVAGPFFACHFSKLAASGQTGLVPYLGTLWNSTPPLWETSMPSLQSSTSAVCLCIF